MNVATTARRIEFIDLLRGWAVIVMIETHVVNATLAEPLRSGVFFTVLNFMNGLVAPSFLFASGMAFAVTARRKLPDYLTFGPQLLRQIGRLLLILAVGYVMHLPAFSYSRLLGETSERAWLLFYQADVLHCIAVTLLVLQGLLLLLRSEAMLSAAAGVFAAAVIVSSPLLWKTDFLAILHPFLAAYLNGLHFSIFPLFPWSAFVLLGVIAGFLYGRARSLTPGGGAEARFMRGATLGGLALVPVALVLQPLLVPVYVTEHYWRTSPGFVLLRLGIVMILLGGMILYERRRGVRSSSSVTLLGRESFLVYTVHLLVIYGTFGPFNFRRAVARSFGYGEALLASLVLLLLMYGLALGWGTLKRTRPHLRRPVGLAVLAVFLLAFFLNPGD